MSGPLEDPRAERCQRDGMENSSQTTTIDYSSAWATGRVSSARVLSILIAGHSFAIMLAIKRLTRQSICYIVTDYCLLYFDDPFRYRARGKLGQLYLYDGAAYDDANWVDLLQLDVYVTVSDGRCFSSG